MVRGLQALPSSRLALAASFALQAAPRLLGPCLTLWHQRPRKCPTQTSAPPLWIEPQGAKSPLSPAAVRVSGRLCSVVPSHLCCPPCSADMSSDMCLTEHLPSACHHGTSETRSGTKPLTSVLSATRRVLLCLIRAPVPQQLCSGGQRVHKPYEGTGDIAIGRFGKCAVFL